MSELCLGPLTLTMIPGETYSVTDCDKEATEVEIPVAVNGIAVTEIGDYAFRDCVLLRRVVFGEATDADYAEDRYLHEIGMHAFMGCTSLRELTLPRGLSLVGWGCFHSCTALERVECDPDTLFSSYSFAHCTALREITPLANISEGVFSHCMSLTYLPIAEGVDTISEDAFEHCEALVEITIPAYVTEIEALAFRGCYSLKKVTFERIECWYDRNSYRAEDVEIDVSDPAENAHDLAWMDFDDGEIVWYRKIRASRHKN